MDPSGNRITTSFSQMGITIIRTKCITDCLSGAVSDDSLQLQRNIGNQWIQKKILSSNSIQVLYEGRHYFGKKVFSGKVMVWDNKGTQISVEVSQHPGKWIDGAGSMGWPLNGSPGKDG